MKHANSKAVASGSTLQTCKRIMAVAMLLILLVSLLPLYSAARYSYAGVDDYRYGKTTHAVWAETHSLPNTVAEAFRVAVSTYTTWQGSIVAVFLMALQPGIFGDSFYGLSTVFLLTVFVLSLLCFVTDVCEYALHADADTARIIAALAAICCVQFVPTPVESYYWFNGGVYYTFFFSLSLVAGALLLRRTQKKTVWQSIVLSFLLLLLGMGNLITGLLCCMLLCLYTVVSICIRKQRDPFLWALTSILLVSFACNVFSPGNGVRQAENASRALGVLPAIEAAITDAIRYSGKWLTTPTLCICLLPIPLFRQIAENAGIRFRCPLLVTAASLLLLAAGFTPNEYALGFAGEARIIDIQYYLFVLLLLCNVLWYTGWVQQRLHLTARVLRAAAVSIVTVSAVAAGIIMFSTRNSATASAILMQSGGKAESYAETWEQRLAILRESANESIVLPKLEHQPPLLCMVDIAPNESDPFYFYNEQIAAYFGKDSVLREP